MGSEPLSKGEPGSLNEHRLKLAVGSVIAGLILLSPVVAFLMVIAAEMVIDLPIEAGASANYAIAAGVMGSILFRRISSHSEIAPEQEPDKAAIAVPPI